MAQIHFDITWDHRPLNRAMRALVAAARRATPCVNEAVEDPAECPRIAALLAIAPDELSRIEVKNFFADGTWKNVAFREPSEGLEKFIAAVRALDPDVAGDAGHECSCGFVCNATVDRVGEGEAQSLPDEVNALSTRRAC